MFQDSLLHPRPAWLVRAFAAVARREFLTALQVAQRFRLPPVEVEETLDALAGEGLLRRLCPPTNLRGDPVAEAFALTRAGAALLAQATGAPPVRVPAPTRSLGPLAHDLGRNAFALALERLDERKALRLLRFETARSKVADAVHVADGGRPRRVPLVADALAVVEINGTVSGLLLEQDEGTVAVERMRLKYQGYEEWWHGGGPFRRFGLRSFRVLTVVPNEARLSRLHEAALKATGNRGSRFLWFATQDSVDINRPERLLDDVWRSATHAPARCRLFAPARTQAAA